MPRKAAKREQIKFEAQRGTSAFLKRYALAMGFNSVTGLFLATIQQWRAAAEIERARKGLVVNWIEEK